jgi:hypothetical protein
VVERVRLGDEPDAEGLSPTLVLVIRSPLEYERSAADGSWRGPRYWASLRPSLSGQAVIRWSLSIGATRGSLEHGWDVVEQGTEAIERTVARRPVGAVDASWVLTRSDEVEGDARYEAGLRIPLCGRTVLLRLAATEPTVDSAGGFLEDGDYLVRGSVKPTVWNRDKVLQTMRGVALRGNLPASRVEVAARGRGLEGRVTDCNRHPVAGARVWLERLHAARWGRVAAATAGDEGDYALRAARPGTYRVAAGSGRSSPIRIR